MLSPSLHASKVFLISPPTQRYAPLCLVLINKQVKPLLFLCVCVCTCHSACGVQRITFKSWLFPSTVWVPGIELRSSGLIAGVSPSEPSCQACMLVFKTIFTLHHCFHALLIVYFLNCVWAWQEFVLFRPASFCSSCLALPTLPLAGFLAAASSLKVSSSELNRVVSELWSSQGYWGCRVRILATELFVFPFLPCSIWVFKNVQFDVIFNGYTCPGYSCQLDTQIRVIWVERTLTQ